MLATNDGQPAAVASSTDDSVTQHELTQDPSVTDSPADDAVTAAPSAQSEVTDLPETTVSNTTEAASDILAANTADGTAEAESVQPDGQQVQPDGQQVQLASPSEPVQDPAAAADAANASNTAALIAVRCFPAPWRTAKVLCTTTA